MCERNRILFVGYTCLDLIYVCNRFHVEDTVQRATHNEWRRGGNASNNCTVFKQLLKWKSIGDFEVEYFGTMADDLFANFLEKDFTDNGIIIENVVKVEGQCPSSSVLINAANGSRTVAHFNKDIPFVTFEAFSKLCLEKYKYIHFEGHRNPDEIRQMVQWVRKTDVNKQIRISVELEQRVEGLKTLFKEEIDIYFVEGTFLRLFNFENSEQTVREISKLVGPKAIVICPWGETGAKAIDNNNQTIYSSPAFAPKDGVVDTLGAGDTFEASTLFAIFFLQYDLEGAIRFGCQVAGAKCGRYGYKHLNQFEKYIRI